jgi:uncharacterized glyoxalase superfamily metalloenzyme YdcJ
MYREEVPAYGTLMDLVAHVNSEVLAANPSLRKSLEAMDGLGRISEERHGAIRLGTAAELAMMRLVFSVMGMYPVGYYDLSTSGVPVHSTAFRPVGDAALNRNPFRVFTSLLRLDLIADLELRETAAAILVRRRIFSEDAIGLTRKAISQGGLSRGDARLFVTEVLETFRWHDKADVGAELYRRLHDTHRLIADVVSFKGPHINHLTPRTLDIDRVQALMPEYGIVPKAVVEGPPARKCPILLRQTSFKALEEPVSFRNGAGGWQPGLHTARFGEIEQRGIALTRKGRGLYDRLLDDTRKIVRPAADGSNAREYEAALCRVFEAFPDDWEAIRRAGLGYFNYSLTEKGRQAALSAAASVDDLVDSGFVQAHPITYEDFLPVSAAGIFQSNLGDAVGKALVASPSQERFEVDLGVSVLDEFEHYAGIEQASLDACFRLLTKPA